MREGNKGFTLIELMVTIAIMAVFSAVVLTTIGTGANSYRRTSSNAKAQMETQEAMDQIQNMLIDVNRSVYYAYEDMDSGTVGAEISNDIDSGADSATKVFFACSAAEKNAIAKEYTYTLDKIEWDSEKQKLYYSCNTWDGVETEVADNKTDSSDQTTQSYSDNSMMISTFSNNGTDTDNGEDSGTTVVSKRTSEVTTKVARTLFADNITDFRVDISKATGDRIIRFQFTTNKSGKKITTVNTVNLRNTVQIQKPDADTGYTPEEEEDAWIAITHYPSELRNGEIGSGFAKTMNGNIDPSTVKWIAETTNATFTGTDDNSIRLQVADNASGFIKIHVEAQTTDGKTITSATVTINIITRTPKELISDQSEFLLPVGKSYEIHDLTNWRIKYNDETTSNPVQNATALSFKMPEITGITLSRAGNLVVSPNVGTQKSNADFTITAEYWDYKTEKTLNGEIHIVLARVDMEEISSPLYVGEKMPGEFIYKEGGVVKTKEVAESQKKISYVRPAAETPDGAVGREITVADIGSWSVKVQVFLSKHSKYGIGSVSAEKAFEVKKITAEVLAVDNIKTLTPGTSTQIYLSIRNAQGPVQASVNWTCNTGAQTKASTMEQSKIHENGFVIPITITADATASEIKTDTWTADYTLEDGTKGTASIDILVTTLRMELNLADTDKNIQTWNGNEAKTISASLYRVGDNVNVTDQYDIEWSLNPQSETGIYSLSEYSGNSTMFKVDDVPEKMQMVAVTATAKEKQTENIVSMSSINITVNTKTTKTKSVNLEANKTKYLNFDTADQKLQILNIRIYCMTKSGVTEEYDYSGGEDTIPTLELSQNATGSLSVKEKTDTQSTENYSYTLISIDLDSVLYNFYIYPKL